MTVRVAFQRWMICVQEVFDVYNYVEKPLKRHLSIKNLCVVCMYDNMNFVHLFLSGCVTHYITETPMAYLARQPQFTQLRQVLQTNPTLLQPILQQIGQSNPRLLQVNYINGIVRYSVLACHFDQIISQNQEAFLQLLNNPEQAMQQQGLGGMPAGGGGVGGLQPGMGLPPRGSPRGPPGAIHIQVTEQEKEAIERVQPARCFFFDVFLLVLLIAKATWISGGVSNTGIFCM